MVLASYVADRPGPAAPLAALAALLLVAHPAAAARYVLAVGHNVGHSDEEPLRWAENTAARVRDVFEELGGARRDTTLLRQAPSAMQVFAAIGELRDMLSADPHRNRAEVLFYYAGHGDSEALHLGIERLALAELRRSIEELPVALRLVILDSCQSTGAARQLGVTAGPSFDIRMEQGSTRGTLVVTSAGPGEPAHESDALGSVVFSHYLLSGLRGTADDNHDAQVTLEEAYAYARGRTLMRTARDGAAVQHPTFDYALKGSGAVVLTWLEAGRSRLVLPEAPGARYLVYRLPQLSFEAEVWGESDGRRELALSRGTFLVQRVAAEGAAEARVDVPWGGRRELATADFSTVDAAALRTQGPAADAELRVVAGAVAAPWGSTTGGAGIGGAARLLRASRGFLLGAEIAGMQSKVAMPQHHGHERRFGIGILGGLEHAAATWRAGACVGLSIEPVWQRLEHDDAERLRRADLPARRRFAAWTGAASLRGYASLDLFGPLFVSLQGLLGARLLPLVDEDGSHIGAVRDAAVELGLGARL